MRLPLYFLAVGGGTLFQSTLAPAVSIGGVTPDLPVVLVVLLAFRRGPEAGCLCGFTLGLAQDVITGGPLGLQALSKSIIGFLAGGLPRWCVISNPLVPVAAGIVATLGDGLLRFAIFQLFQYPAPFGELVAGVMLPQAAYNGLVAAIVVALPGIRART